MTKPRDFSLRNSRSLKAILVISRYNRVKGDLIRAAWPSEQIKTLGLKFGRSYLVTSLRSLRLNKVEKRYGKGWGMETFRRLNEYITGRSKPLQGLWGREREFPEVLYSGVHDSILELYSLATLKCKPTLLAYFSLVEITKEFMFRCSQVILTQQ